MSMIWSAQRRHLFSAMPIVFWQSTSTLRSGNVDGIRIVTLNAHCVIANQKHKKMLRQ